MYVYCLMCKVYSIKVGFPIGNNAELCGIKELTSKIHLRWKPYLKVYNEVVYEFYDLVVLKTENV